VEPDDCKNKNLICSFGVSPKELHRQLFYARLKKWETISIHSDNKAYYLYCIAENGGYKCVIIRENFTLPSQHILFKKFLWYPKYLKNEIFGISEVVNIFFDILKIIKLIIFG
jgi:hypothetical protein